MRWNREEESKISNMHNWGKCKKRTQQLQHSFSAMWIIDEQLKLDCVTHFHYFFTLNIFFSFELPCSPPGVSIYHCFAFLLVSKWPRIARDTSLPLDTVWIKGYTKLDNNLFHGIIPDSRKKRISLFEMGRTENQVILRLPVDIKTKMWRKLPQN